MSVCKTLVDKKNTIVEEIKLHSSIQFLENDPEYAERILAFVNKKEKTMKIKADPKVLGSGSFGVVYKGTLVKRNKEYKVAIKIKKITAYDEKITHENEVKMQEKIYKIKKPNGDNITPRVFLCAFICSSDILTYKNRDVCEGIQVIVMERKTPMRISKLEFNSVKDYKDLLVQGLKNYDILVKNGVYMYDIKPENNVIEIQEDGKMNVQVIDTDPEFVFNEFKGSFFEKMSKNTFQKIFLVLTQIMYMINYTDKVNNTLTTKYYKRYLEECAKDKYISNLLKKFTGYFSVIYAFLMNEDYNSDDDKYFSKLLLKYTIDNDIYRNKTRKSQVKAFIDTIKKMFPIEEKETMDTTIKKKTKKVIQVVKKGKVQSEKIPKFTSSRTES
jgi:ribosomal protein S20